MDHDQSSPPLPLFAFSPFHHPHPLTGLNSPSVTLLWKWQSCWHSCWLYDSYDNTPGGCVCPVNAGQFRWKKITLQLALVVHKRGKILHINYFRLWSNQADLNCWFSQTIRQHCTEPCMKIKRHLSIRRRCSWSPITSYFRENTRCPRALSTE